MLINTRICAPRIMLLRFINSLVNSFIEIYAGGITDNLDGGFSIGQVPQHRHTMRSPSTVADQRSGWWFAVDTITILDALVSFSTEEQFSQFQSISMEFLAIQSL
jgi:heme A synthase